MLRSRPAMTSFMMWRAQWKNHSNLHSEQQWSRNTGKHFRGKYYIYMYKNPSFEISVLRNRLSYCGILVRSVYTTDEIKNYYRIFSCRCIYLSLCGPASLICIFHILIDYDLSWKILMVIETVFHDFSWYDIMIIHDVVPQGLRKLKYFELKKFKLSWCWPIYIVRWWSIMI